MDVAYRMCPETDYRGMVGDAKRAIAWLKRYITDTVQPPTPAPAPITRAEKIAIIGGGPAGLTAARDLILRGYAVTVFEELPHAGGMMRYAIPEYRLPRATLDREVDDIRALGVEIKTGVRVGKDIDLARIRAAFDCVVLAIGAHRSWTLDIEGENLKGVEGAAEFLRRVNLNNNTLKVGKRVAVIGGGNSAIDAARTALRLGAKEVNLAYRRTRQEMPAEDLWTFKKIGEKEGKAIEVLQVGCAIDTETGACAVQPIEFGQSALQGTTGLDSPTSLAFGPDGRLYASQQNGLIRAYTVTRSGAIETILSPITPLKTTLCSKMSTSPSTNSGSKGAGAAVRRVIAAA